MRYKLIQQMLICCFFIFISNASIYAKEKNIEEWTRFFKTHTEINYKNSYYDKFNFKFSSLSGVKKTNLNCSKSKYDYYFSLEGIGGNTDNYINIEKKDPFGFTLFRDNQKDRLIGGSPVVKNYSLLSNYYLDNLILENNNSENIVRFNINYDKSIFLNEYHISLKKIGQKSVKNIGLVNVFITTSKNINFSFDSEKFSAVHRKIFLVDKNLEDILYTLSFFSCWKKSNPDNKIRISSVTHQNNQNFIPFDFSSLENIIDHQSFADFENDPSISLPALGLTALIRIKDNDEKGDLPNNKINMPPEWAFEAYNIFNILEIQSSAAVEKAPNFVISATIGAILLIDSGISATSSLLHSTGVTDREYKGIPNYIGQGVGLAAANTAEVATKIIGKDFDADESKWMDWGGFGGDVASLAISAGSMTKAGTKVIKGLKLDKLNKAFKISGKGFKSLPKIAVTSANHFKKNALIIKPGSKTLFAITKPVTEKGKFWLKQEEKISNVLSGITTVNKLFNLINKSQKNNNIVNSYKKEEIHRDIIIIVDTSGSNLKTDPFNLRKKALEMASDILPPDISIGLIKFNDNSQILTKPLPLNNFFGPNRNEIKLFINQIDSAGGTNIKKALKLASEITVNKNTTWVLITDGQDPAFKGKTELIPEKVKVHTIALSSDSDKENLAKLSSATGGIPEVAEAAEDLPRIFANLFGDVFNEQLVLSESDTIKPDQEKTYEFNLNEKVKNLIHYLNWPGSDLDMTLISPEGDSINIKEAVLLCSGTESETFEIINIPNPQPGKWKVKVKAIEVNTTGEPFNLRASLNDSENNIKWKNPVPVNEVNKPVEINVQNNQKIKWQKYEFTLEKPDGTLQEEEKKVDRFSASEKELTIIPFTPEETGVYKLNLKIYGNEENSNKEIQRSFNRNINVNPKGKAMRYHQTNNNFIRRK